MNQTGSNMHHSKAYNKFIERDGLEEVKNQITDDVIQDAKHVNGKRKENLAIDLVYIYTLMATPLILMFILDYVLHINRILTFIISIGTLIVGIVIPLISSKNEEEIEYKVNLYDVIIKSLFPEAYSIDENTFIDNVVLNTYAVSERVGIYNKDEKSNRGRTEKINTVSFRNNNGLYEGGERLEKLSNQEVAYAYNLNDENNTQIAHVSETHKVRTRNTNYTVTDFLGITLKCNFSTNGKWIRVAPKYDKFFQVSDEYLIRTEDVFINENFNIYSNDEIWARKIITADVMTLLWESISYANKSRKGKVSFVITNNELAVSYFNSLPLELSEHMAEKNYKVESDYNRVRESINRVYGLADLMVCNQ